MSLFLTLLLTLRISLRITYLRITLHMSLLLTLNIFHILHDMKNAKIRALYRKKERKVSLTD